MWLTASEIPVRLEILDSFGDCASTSDARVVRLDDSYAEIVLDRDPSSDAHRSRSGTPVRFEFEEGMRRYEVTGAIVAGNVEQTDSREIAARVDTAESEQCHMRVRIWECKLNIQRRSVPRRRLGFPVELRGISDSEPTAIPASEAIVGCCIDVGAGGIRVRTSQLLEVPKRMRLEFSLPVSDGTLGIEANHRFCLSGRVIHTLPQGAHGDDMDIAFCFEGLSVRDGMALHHLLS